MVQTGPPGPQGAPGDQGPPGDPGPPGTGFIGIENVEDLKDTNTSPLSDYQILGTAGYHAADDGGGALYYYLSGATDTADDVLIIEPNSGNGRFFLKHDGRVSAMQGGCVGDGVADDSARLQYLLDNLPHIWIILNPGKTFRCDTALVFEDNQVYAKGATVNYHATGLVNGHLPKDRAYIFGGAWHTISGVSGIASGFRHTAFQIGAYALEIGEPSGTGFRNIILEALEFSTTEVGGIGIFITGDSSEIRLVNLSMPASATTKIALDIHWGGWKPTAYSVGDTKHMHAIQVRNLRVGAMTYDNGETMPFFLSGGYDVSVDGLICDSCNVGLWCVAGDTGFLWADPAIAKLAYTGIEIKNVMVKSCRAYGIIVNGRSTDTSNGAAVQAWRMPIRFVNCTLVGDDSTSGSNDKAGYSPRHVDGVIFEDCTISNFKSGFRPTNHPGAVEALGTTNIVVKRGRIHHNRFNGVHLINEGHANQPVQGIIFDGVEVDNNGLSGTTVTDASGFYVSVCTECAIRDCVIGDIATETGQLASIRTETGSNAPTKIVIRDNKSRSLKSGAAGHYSFGSSTDIGFFSYIGNNQIAGPVSARYNGSLAQFHEEILPQTITVDASASFILDAQSGGINKVKLSAAITATRTVTFSIVAFGGLEGREILFQRTAAATGDFPWVIGAYGSLYANQWMRVRGVGLGYQMVEVGIGEPGERPQNGQIGELLFANMAITTDQTIPIKYARYKITKIVVENASTSMTEADGGIYTAGSKGGTQVVAFTQVYTALTTSLKNLELTLNDNDTRTEQLLYLSLTGGQSLEATVTASTLTRSGTTATFTATAPHGYTTGQTVTVSGATQGDYNVTAVITVTGASTFTYTVANSPATPATGSPIAKRNPCADIRVYGDIY